MSELIPLFSYLERLNVLRYSVNLNTQQDVETLLVATSSNKQAIKKDQNANKKLQRVTEGTKVKYEDVINQHEKHMGDLEEPHHNEVEKEESKQEYPKLRVEHVTE